MRYEILEYMDRDTDIVLHLSSRDWYVLEKSPIWAELEKEVDRIQSKHKMTNSIYEEKDAILNEFLEMMSDGIKRAQEKGWIPETAPREDRVSAGIAYIIAHQMGNVND